MDKYYRILAVEELRSLEEFWETKYKPANNIIVSTDLQTNLLNDLVLQAPPAGSWNQARLHVVGRTYTTQNLPSCNKQGCHLAYSLQIPSVSSLAQRLSYLINKTT